MKNNLEKVSKIVELFGDNAFYKISVYSGCINLYGKFDTSIVQRCMKDGYHTRFDENGCPQLDKDNVVITLTQ